MRLKLNLYKPVCKKVEYFDVDIDSGNALTCSKIKSIADNKLISNIGCPCR